PGDDARKALHHGRQLAGHVLQARWRRAAALEAPFDQRALPLGFGKVLLDPAAKLGIVLEALDLGPQYLLGLLLHGVGIAQPAIEPFVFRRHGYLSVGFGVARRSSDMRSAPAGREATMTPASGRHAPPVSNGGGLGLFRGGRGAAALHVVSSGAGASGRACSRRCRWRTLNMA